MSGPETSEGGKDANGRGQELTRRAFIAGALGTPAVLPRVRAIFGEAGMASSRPALVERNSYRLISPNGKLRFELTRDGSSRLTYRITLGSNPVIETARLGIIVDNVDLGQGAEARKIDSYHVNESYTWRGVHSKAANRCNCARISVIHRESKTTYIIEVRAFDDGVAFRHAVAGDGRSRVPDEATGFAIPSGSSVWYHDFEGHYEGIHIRKEVSQVQPGEWAAPPLTFKLPAGAGYAAITEAALVNYSGMGLQADGKGVFKARLGHAEPVSYPFRLRYGVDEGKRLATPAAISGTIVTPWRVVMAGADLNRLVNCDIVNNLCPPPDNELFPLGINTEWIRPGRAVWKYLDGGENTLDGMKEFSRLAGELGFEYNVVEGFWQKWPEDQIRELVEYSNRFKVRLWLWKHSKDLRTPEAREGFFKLCSRLGVAGAKIDFFDHEAREIVDLYYALLEEAARHKIMLDFHGANKPTGEARTWPNELTREGIRGLEYRNMQTRAQHNTTLPFTRMLAGPADYTPMIFGERRRETSWAHQIASAVILTSPLLVYAAHPKSILDNRAVDVIKSIPSVWDETIALPICEIGEIAAFARRSGDQWFLAIMNGPAARTVKLAPEFLGGGQYQAVLVRDRLDDAATLAIDLSTGKKSDLLTIELRAGGGFIGRFSPTPSVTRQSW
jgi:alpha-glucosidase